MPDDAASRRGKRSRRKGRQFERDLVKLLERHGIRAECVPLSGAIRYRGNGGDIDVYTEDDNPHEIPLKFEAKKRASGEGFATLERWLGDNDGLFLCRDRGTPFVVLPWTVWLRLLK